MPASLAESVRSADATAIMALFPHRPRLLAVGEPTHGAEALLDLRNRIFRQLVDTEDYRIIALESDAVMSTTVDDYVTSGIGTLDDAMRGGFSHEWGLLAGNRELVRWMREYNAARPRPEMVRFAGFDGPLEMTAAASPRRVLTELHRYLARWVDTDLVPITSEALDRLLGDDAQWTDPQAMMDPTRSIGRSAQSVELRLLADDLVALLQSESPHLLDAASREDWNRAGMYGRTATGLLRYHYWMADPSPARMARLCGLRDSMMASNLMALAERAPTLVYAHNSHLQRQQSRMQMWQGAIEWWSAGAVVSRQLTDDYAFLPTAVGTIEHHGVGAPSPNTVEGLLYAVPRTELLVDTHSLTTLHDFPLEARESPWFGYAPFDPEHCAASDGLLFVQNASESE